MCAPSTMPCSTLIILSCPRASCACRPAPGRPARPVATHASRHSESRYLLAIVRRTARLRRRCQLRLELCTQRQKRHLTPVPCVCAYVCMHELASVRRSGCCSARLTRSAHVRTVDHALQRLDHLVLPTSLVRVPAPSQPQAQPVATHASRHSESRYLLAIVCRTARLRRRCQLRLELCTQ